MTRWSPNHCGFLCVALCSPVTLLLFPHLGKNVYMHQYMYLCPSESPCLLIPLCMETWVPLCSTVSCSHPTSGATPWLECVYVSVHVFMSICILTWKHGCPCMALCMCPSHLISIPTPCSECVHASVHILMSTWVPNSAQPPLPSYMEIWVLVCGTVCMFQLVHFWSHTLIKICTWIRTCIYVHLTPLVSSTPHG